MSTAQQNEPNPASPDHTRMPRQSRLIKAALGCDRFGRFDVTIRNVSQTGFGGHGPHILNRGERVAVDLPGHASMRGTVRWVANQRFGIETDCGIRLDDLRPSGNASLSSVDGSYECRIIPPPIANMRRPGLVGRAVSQPDRGKSNWVSD